MPGSRVFAISGKDRASILMAGPKADGVYWFQDGFGFLTAGRVEDYHFPVAAPDKQAVICLVERHGYVALA